MKTQFLTLPLPLTVETLLFGSPGPAGSLPQVLDRGEFPNGMRGSGRF